MSFVPLQAIWIVGALFVIWLSYKLVKKAKWGALGVVWFIVVLSFVASPARYQQEGGASLDASVDRFGGIPDKVVVESEKFEASQEREMAKLKSQREGMKNEIHN
jgi:hypothetical protein